MNVTSIITLAVSLFGVLSVGVLVPVLLVGRAERTRHADALEAARLHREDREAEWARQDELAARAARATADLARNQEEIVGRAEENQKETNGKLDAIHTLVNSNMTAAMQAEFDALTGELASMREVIDLKRIAGLEPTRESLDAMALTEAKLHDLSVVLADRARAQAALDKKEQDEGRGGR